MVQLYFLDQEKDMGSTCWLANYFKVPGFMTGSFIKVAPGPSPLPNSYAKLYNKWFAELAKSIKNLTC